MEQVDKRIETAEGQVSELEAEVSSHSDSITSVESDVSGMKKEHWPHCEDLEARSRRCNICITGVKEGREHGKHPSQFVANMLKETLDLEKPPTLDHCTLRSKETPVNLPPQVFVVKCHCFSEKVDVKESHRAQAVSKQQAAFTKVRGLLWGCEGVRCGLRYPVILRITTLDRQEASFKNPKLAEELILKNVVCEGSD